MRLNLQRRDRSRSLRPIGKGGFFWQFVIPELELKKKTSPLFSKLSGKSTARPPERSVGAVWGWRLSKSYSKCFKGELRFKANSERGRLSPIFSQRVCPILRK